MVSLACVRAFVAACVGCCCVFLLVLYVFVVVCVCAVMRVCRCLCVSVFVFGVVAVRDCCDYGCCLLLLCVNVADVGYKCLFVVCVCRW